MTSNFKARIVIADDDTESAAIVEQGLKLDGHQVRTCPDGEAALHLIRSWSPQIVLLDINMPKMSGLEVLRKVRSLGGGEYIGIIMVTANSDLDEIISGLDAGADDYVIKPYRIDELRARVRACLRVKALHDSLRRANKRLEDSAALDDLTSLYNMRFMVKRLPDEMELAQNEKSPISCIMFDMDTFKSINDKHDHLFGSEVLCEVAKIVKSNVRPTDLAARYGGDEFFILLPKTNVHEAYNVAERLRKAIESHTFKTDQHTAKATASFGVAGAEDAAGVNMLDARELMRAADNAMYSAKSGGRNRTEIYNFLGNRPTGDLT